MELIKNIFFNTDRLTPFITLKISYTGKFFDNASEKVFMHYTFDDKWQDLEMVKSELGFQAEINLPNSPCLQLCFFNEKNEWDNNESKNYTFPIEKAELSLIALDGYFSLVSPRRLSKFYLWKKKFKITIYKAITYLPKLISGKYTRKLNENN